MRWHKLGQVYCPAGDKWWARAYAHLPTPELVEDGVIRVYFAGLDENKYGRLGWVDLDARDPLRVLGEAEEPVLDLGELGSFDDCGVVPSCAARLGGERCLYYIGFQRAQRVPYMLFTGLARCDPSAGRWERHSRTPVLDRTGAEPFSRSAPWVVREGGRFRMWYWSCVRWAPTPAGAHYNNVILHAASDDGIHWQGDGRLCLSPSAPGEYALGRPAVVRDGGLYRMWFSARSHPDGYAIGYAESPDGLDWVRKDEQVGIHRSDEGWDAEMICYPAVIDAGGRRLMFYNGNRHGATGFGVAVLEDDRP
jgi:predicted GH43/DUF377 family glycosyl hydrolase